MRRSPRDATTRGRPPQPGGRPLYGRRSGIRPGRPSPVRCSRCRRSGG
ncbi:phage DNA packaging protein J [Streptomyces sp. NPDC127117]